MIWYLYINAMILLLFHCFIILISNYYTIHTNIPLFFIWVPSSFGLLIHNALILGIPIPSLFMETLMGNHSNQKTSVDSSHCWMVTLISHEHHSFSFSISSIISSSSTYPSVVILVPDTNLTGLAFLTIQVSWLLHPKV